MKRGKLLVIGLVIAALCMCLCGCASKEYTPEKKNSTVDSTALQTAGKLRVGVDASKAPYAVTSSGSIIGIDVDMAAALADQLGLELELVDVGSDVAKAFTSEKVDIVMGVTEQGSSYALSSSYLTTGVCLFATDKNATVPQEATSTLKIAAQASSMSAWEVTDHYGDSYLISSSSLADAFKALSSNTATYVSSDSIIGSYAAHSANVDAYPIALLSDKTDRCVAVKASTNTTLLNAVNDALKSMKSGGMTDFIVKKWVGKTVSISDLPQITAKADSSSSTSSSTSTSTSSSN